MSAFQDKIVWITGASSGIGKAMAISFAKAGAQIILSGRRVDALEAVAAELPTDSMILPFETTDYSVLSAKVDAAWGWKNGVDILVNNAGISQRSLAVDTDPQVHTDIVNIDLLAPIWLTQLLLPKLVARGDGGHIVAISSVAGRVGVPLRTAYCAAKHGLIGYMDALRAEVTLPHGIHVTNILPGSVATDVSRNALTKDGSVRGKSDDAIDNGDDPMDCAAAILEAVENQYPELIYAKDMELGIANLRMSDPALCFQMTAGLGEQIVANYEAGNDD